MSNFAQPTAPKSYREELAGCVAGVVTYKSVYYCDPKTGPTDGSGTDTDAVSFFYQIAADGTKTVVDWATTAAAWTPGACPTASDAEFGVITNPDDPTGAEIPVMVTVDPLTGTPIFTSLVDGSVVTPGAGEEFRLNTTDFEIVSTFGCIKDKTGATVAQAQQVVVYNEDAAIVSTTIVDPTTGAAITLAGGETFGSCSSGLPSELDCGCLIDDTNGTVRAASREMPRNPDTGLVDWGAVTYVDGDGAALVKAATEAFQCGPCPEVLAC